MAYTTKPRPYKKEYEQQKKRTAEHERRMERQRARRKIDKEGKDANGNGVADKREGKDVSHKKALSKSKNRSFKRNSSKQLVSETSTRERKKRKKTT
jgi:hypothetical protein